MSSQVLRTSMDNNVARPSNQITSIEGALRLSMDGNQVRGSMDRRFSQNTDGGTRFVNERRISEQVDYLEYE